MVELTTTDFNKVDFNIDIVTRIYSNTIEVNEHKIFELMCLHYDCMIRNKTENPISEIELVVRFYNILSDYIEYDNDDFTTIECCEFNYIDRIINYLNNISGDPENIEIYINKVYSKYGILFKIYRNIEICHNVVNLYKKGAHIPRHMLTKEKTLKSMLDTIMKTLYNYDSNVSIYIVDITEKAYKLLDTINKQKLRKAFIDISKRIPIVQ